MITGFGTLWIVMVHLKVIISIFKNGQSITYATDYDSQIDNVDVSGDIDPDLDGILIDFLSIYYPNSLSWDDNMEALLKRRNL